jgi:hypothetical protein
VVRRVTAFSSDRASGIDEINQGLTGAKLSKAKLSWAAFQLTAQNIAIEFHHLIEVVYPQNDVVDQSDIDGIGSIHVVHPISTYTYLPGL